MSERLRIDLFCEDRAHEELLRALVRRLCEQEAIQGQITVRSARGGHGTALRELELYQRVVREGVSPSPDVLVVAIDTNCQSYREAVRGVEARIDHERFPYHAIACPNPHVELWYMADPEAFERVIGVAPPPVRPACGKQGRHALKRALAQSVRAAGHPVVFGGIEYARELAEAMDLFRAGKVDAGFHHFVRDVTGALRRLSRPSSGS
jgi:hypothetical protein